MVITTIRADEITHRKPLKQDKNKDKGGTIGNDNIYEERLSICLFIGLPVCLKDTDFYFIF